MKAVRVGLGVLVVNAQGEVLLGQRKNAHGEGLWAPPGGHLEFGETPEEGAQRELLEETGLVAEKIVAGPWINEFYPELDKHYISLFFVIPEFKGQCVNKEPHLCEGWSWIHPSAWPELLFKPLKSLKERYDIGALVQNDSLITESHLL